MSNIFANAMRNETRKTYTENGATAFNSTSNGLLDFFGSAGSLRSADEDRINRLFADAFETDSLLATKALFYVRDIRGGLGERRTFRILLHNVANKHPEVIRPNIHLIGEYGRFDDLYELIDTPLENDMWTYMKQQLTADLEAMSNNKPCSLLAKWMKTADASSRKTRELGILTAYKLGYSVYSYKRIVRALRKYIDVTEIKMTQNNWSEIDYSAVPSRAMMNYRNAFNCHDKERYSEFINRAVNGEAKIHAATLYPYDIIEKYIAGNCFWRGFGHIRKDNTIEALWNALPDYVGQDANAIVIADTSGSMSGRPICSAVGLAIYFAQRNTGAYHNMWMNFSNESVIQYLKGDSLAEQISNFKTEGWGANTNLEKAFMKILNIAVENNIAPEEMIKSLIIISDMEIDYCTSNSWLFYDEMRNRYAEAGYEIPNIVFWNVDSRHDIFHADKDRKGVQLCSGQSTSTFKQLMQSVGMTPIEMMMNVLNSERYAPIRID